MGGSGGGGGYYSGGTGSSGSGGDGGAGGGEGGGPDSSDLCAITASASLHAPDSDYTASLSLGTVLNVSLGGPNGRTLQVHSVTGYQIGTLIGLSIAGQLIDCIQQGNNYTATVTQKDGGAIGVLVQRAAT